jgi:hypothetical protein
MGKIKKILTTLEVIKIGSSLSDYGDRGLLTRLMAVERGPLLEEYADNLDNTGEKIAERVSVWRDSDKHGVFRIDLTAHFEGSAKDNRAEFDAWLRRELIKAIHTVARYRSGNPSALVDGDSADREDNPRRTFQTSKYDGSTEKRIYPEHIAQVYPKLRGKMANLTNDEEGYVINELWSFIAATIEESPILQKAGWAVGTEPDGDNFAVYYEAIPRGQSFEDIIEQDVILAVDEVESGSYALRHDEDGDGDDREDNPRADSMRDRCNQLYPQRPRRIHHRKTKTSTLPSLLMGGGAGLVIGYLFGKRK